MNFKSSKTYQVYFVAAIASIFLSILRFYHYPVFNIDGLLYLKAANAFLSQGLKASMSVYGWPFYSIILALISKSLHLTLLHTGYLLNYIFSVLTVLIFIRLVEELGGSTKLLWLAALIILTYLSFNHFRADILRDNGYWFFYLLSIFYLFRFMQNTKWSYAILWGLSILIGALFRIEGIMFLLLVPFVVFFCRQFSMTDRFKSYIKLNILLSVFVIILSVVFFLHHNVLLQSGRLYELLKEFSGGVHLFVNFPSMNIGVKQHVIGQLAANDSVVFLFFGLLGLFLYNVVGIISLGYLVATCFARFKPENSSIRPMLLILAWYVAINVFVLSVYFLQQEGFLSDRYLIALALTLLIFVPFGLSYLYERWRECPKKLNVNNILFWFVCLTIVWMTVGSLHRFGPSKVYIYKSAQWIRKNAPKNAKIYTNHAVLGSLVERQSGGYEPQNSDYFTDQKIVQKPWAGYNYAIFVISNHDKKTILQIEQTMKQKPIQVYYGNHHRDQAAIFKIPKED